ncbi:sensor histidine kinase [Planctomycetes bacterium TBK1r]|uniref:histidine kinase n=1 Tax=Stieleria magnilauensis TaxID=2527963 RepID=A0ABX5XVU8_9BACT|nr:Sporulation kinase E [Planctomycetes bacterium TBK1r]
MKLAAKLILVFMLGVLGIVALFSWQTIRRQHDRDEVRRAEHADDVVGAITPAINEAFRNGGVVTIQEAVEFSAQYVPSHDLRWVDGVKTEDAPTKVTSRRVSRISVSDADGSRVAHTFVPVVIDGTDAGGVEVSESMANHEHFIRGSLFASLLSLLGVATLSGVVIYFGGVQLVGKPLGKLIEQVHEIGDGKLSQPPALTSNDELGSLALAISQMSGRLDQQQNTIRHTDRLGTVGTLAAGMAHEMGTPLNVVAGRANLIASGKLSAEEIEQSAKTIKSEAERMTTIIRQLLDFARQSPSEHSTIDVRNVARKTCELMETLAEKSSCKIVLHTDDDPCRINGDATQIQQVLTNLITNAIQATPDGGNIIVAVERQCDANQVCVRVSDEGVGIEPADIKRVFEPFYTTKDVGQGTGLGLSIAYGIVKEHGGEVKVESANGQSTTFTVYLPTTNQS